MTTTYRAIRVDLDRVAVPTGDERSGAGRNTKMRVLLAVTASLLLLVGAWRTYVGWREAHLTTGANAILDPLRALLRENRGLLAELQSDAAGETASDTLEAYLAKIRRDGVPAQATMKRHIDRLVQNNVAMMVLLLRLYAPQARSDGFRQQADRFQSYATALSDRWDSVMEIYMAGGNYAQENFPYPAELAAAVDQESLP